MKPIISNSSIYKDWLYDLKLKIRQSQIKASISVNTELLKLYWELGKDIAEKQLDSVWGTGFFENLSRDLKKEFPEMQGFSITNLKYTKRFYLFYSQDNTIRHQRGDELISDICKIPWRHQIEIFTKCKSIEEAYFYISQTIENGWGRALLMNMLDSGLFESAGKAITNFTKVLPPPMSDLAQQTLKDPYNNEFKPEYLGQLGFYVSAVNHQLKQPTDKPTIGLVICKNKNNVVAEYALESAKHPIGISEYELTKLIPEEFKGTLPSIEEIEAELR